MRIARACFLALLLSPISSYGAVPIHIPSASGFVPNRGQAPPEILHYAAIPGGAVYLTRTAIILDTWEREAPAPAPNAGERIVRRRGHATWLRFAGSDPGVAVEGAEPGPSRLNFLVGNDPSAWRSNVPLHARVTYKDLWPGIDLVLTTETDGVACAVEARDGADTGAARFEREAGDGTSPEEIGLRELSALLAGADGRTALDNPSALVWSSFLGGSAEEIGWSVALDSQGNPVVTGLNTSAFFPTTPGAYDQFYSGLGDVFVSKLSANGSALLWSTFLGGTSLQFDYGYAVTVDALDNPIVTGYTRSEDFPVTAGALDTEYNGEADVFVTKLNPSGSALAWSTFIGGATHDIGYDLDLDSSGNVVVAGRTLSFEFPATGGAYDDSQNGEEDGFLLKLSPGGNTLLWSTFFGGSLYDGVQAVQLDAADAPIVCGYTASTDFPGGSANGLYDIFVAKFSSAGSALSWSRLVGGGSYDYGTDLALDSMGNPVICGSTGSSDFPVTPGAYDMTYNGDDDVVAAKLAAVDGALVWATFVGGTTPVYEIAQGVTLDSANRPILVGATPSPDFPTTLAGFDGSHNGASDVFVTRLSASGASLEWSTFLGGPGDDYAFALALSATGDALVTGSADAGFPVTSGAYDVTYNGDIADVFVARLALAPGGTSVSDGGYAAPSPLTVSPNPVVGTTRIAFRLPIAAMARVEIFDAQGRLVGALDGGLLGAGPHTLDWNPLDRDGRPLASGVYAVRVTAGDWAQSQRVVLVR